MKIPFEISSQTFQFQVSQQPIPNMGCSNRNRHGTKLLICSWYDKVTVTGWSLK